VRDGTDNDLWRGEAKSAEIVEWVVKKANAARDPRRGPPGTRTTSPDRWTYAREAFERMLYANVPMSGLTRRANRTIPSLGSGYRVLPYRR
jgi:hypothetical protein